MDGILKVTLAFWLISERDENLYGGNACQSRHYFGATLLDYFGSWEEEMKLSSASVITHLESKIVMLSQALCLQFEQPLSGDYEVTGQRLIISLPQLIRDVSSSGDDPPRDLEMYPISSPPTWMIFVNNDPNQQFQSASNQTTPVSYSSKSSPSHASGQIAMEFLQEEISSLY